MSDPKFEIGYKSSQMTNMSAVTFTLDPKQARLQEQFESGDAVEDLLYVEGRGDNKKPYRIVATVECLGDLIDGEYGHSFLCKFINDDDATLFESIEDSAASVLSTKIDFKPFVKDEKFFVKLPFKNDKYRTIIDPAFLPSQPEKCTIVRGSHVELEFTTSMWVNFKKAAAGMFLNVSKVTIDGGKKRVVRKR